MAIIELPLASRTSRSTVSVDRPPMALADGLALAIATLPLDPTQGSGQDAILGPDHLAGGQPSGHRRLLRSGQRDDPKRRPAEQHAAVEPTTGIQCNAEPVGQTMGVTFCTAGRPHAPEHATPSTPRSPTRPPLLHPHPR